MHTGCKSSLQRGLFPKYELRQTFQVAHEALVKADSDAGDKGCLPGPGGYKERQLLRWGSQPPPHPGSVPGCCPPGTSQLPVAPRKGTSSAPSALPSCNIIRRSLTFTHPIHHSKTHFPLTHPSIIHAFMNAYTHSSIHSSICALIHACICRHSRHEFGMIACDADLMSPV